MNGADRQGQERDSGDGGEALPQHPLVYGVDDDPLLLAAFRELLAAMPIRLRCFASGEEALEAIYSELPDALVSDYRMPGMSGLELILRVQQQWPAVRVALHTSDAMAQSRAARLRIPFIARGALPDEMRQFVSALLR